jgi:hypothetical protein
MLVSNGANKRGFISYIFLIMQGRFFMKLFDVNGNG